MPNSTVRDKSDLQLLHPDRFNGIGKFEGEYHIATDPDVPPVVHAPRKCPIHIGRVVQSPIKLTPGLARILISVL